MSVNESPEKQKNKTKHCYPRVTAYPRPCPLRNIIIGFILCEEIEFTKIMMRVNNNTRFKEGWILPRNDIVYNIECTVSNNKLLDRQKTGKYDPYTGKSWH